MSLDVAGGMSPKNPCFLANEGLHPYIKMSDCSQVSDGAAAILLVSEAGLQRLNKTQRCPFFKIHTKHLI